MKPYFETELGKLYHGDCLEVMPQLEPVDLVLTDPPYPDYHTEIYAYKPELIKCLKTIDCKQYIFWSAKVQFPINYTAIHIWNKCRGVGSTYERIFERNGGKLYKVYSVLSINSKIAAGWVGDDFTGHPSQKPKQLIMAILESEKYNTVLDLYFGSGSVGIVSERLNRRWIGIEISEEYCEIAAKRIENETRQLKLFV